MDQSEARKATNESLFREGNERIEETARHFSLPDRLQFVCECSDVTCSDRITLSIEEYEEVRAAPERFAIALHHDDAEVDRVVETREGYAVVEKVGAAREIAKAQDPRA